jgi:hypothetical protein
MSKAIVVSFPKNTKARELQYLIDQYHKAHPDQDPAEVAPHLVAEWGIRTGRYNRPPLDPVVQLRRDLSRHLRNEYVTDPQGREVRKNHPVMIPVQTQNGEKLRPLYKELFHAPAEHMAASFKLRRRGVERDVMQMDLDFRSYNDNNVYGTTLDPMDYDFNKDVVELNMPTTYPDGMDDDDDDDDVN